MPNRDALAGLSQALAAIDVMIRSGKGQGGRLVEMAREARVAAERMGSARHAAALIGGKAEAVPEKV